MLDAALARAIATLAHDLRNALGVVSMQVEVIALRCRSATPDVASIAASAAQAADHIERLADMTNAMISFASGRTSSDLAVIVGEASALVPLRQVVVSSPTMAVVGTDSTLTRAIALEVLVMALKRRQAPELTVVGEPSGSTLRVVSDAPLAPDESMEWVVQFKQAGGRLDVTDDGLRLHFPPIV